MIMKNLIIKFIIKKSFDRFLQRENNQDLKMNFI